MERARKRKRATSKLLREVAPTGEEKMEIEENGVFEDYPEKPMLSPRDEEEMPTHNRAKIGKRELKSKRAAHLN